MSHAGGGAILKIDQMSCCIVAVALILYSRTDLTFPMSALTTLPETVT